ncbi:hypothetical protein PAPYR_5153 [Paratrimastix pyriformis]|uniref:Uncharacterized protein n=1 Tax=Paratrimastix pyriformis TaxID=342808 RepID=A0ABQ8UIN7_9EUKA|nr:hypothetical protein PAPYR_5153 [Paratrimastix pyriformis]
MVSTEISRGFSIRDETDAGTCGLAAHEGGIWDADLPPLVLPPFPPPLIPPASIPSEDIQSAQEREASADALDDAAPEMPLFFASTTAPSPPSPCRSPQPNQHISNHHNRHSSDVAQQTRPEERKRRPASAPQGAPPQVTPLTTTLPSLPITAHFPAWAPSSTAPPPSFRPEPLRRGIPLPLATTPAGEDTASSAPADSGSPPPSHVQQQSWTPEALPREGVFATRTGGQNRESSDEREQVEITLAGPITQPSQGRAEEGVPTTTIEHSISTGGALVYGPSPADPGYKEANRSRLLCPQAQNCLSDEQPGFFSDGSEDATSPPVAPGTHTIQSHSPRSASSIVEAVSTPRMTSDSGAFRALAQQNMESFATSERTVGAGDLSPAPSAAASPPPIRPPIPLLQLQQSLCRRPPAPPAEDAALTLSSTRRSRSSTRRSIPNTRRSIPTIPNTRRSIPSTRRSIPNTHRLSSSNTHRSSPITHRFSPRLATAETWRILCPWTSPPKKGSHPTSCLRDIPPLTIPSALGMLRERSITRASLTLGSTNLPLPIPGGGFQTSPVRLGLEPTHRNDMGPEEVLCFYDRCRTGAMSVPVLRKAPKSPGGFTNAEQKDHIAELEALDQALRDELAELEVLQQQR